MSFSEHNMCLYAIDNKTVHPAVCTDMNDNQQQVLDKGVF